MVPFIFSNQNIQIFAIPIVRSKLASLREPFSLDFPKLGTKNGQLSVALEPEGVGVGIGQPMALPFGSILIKTDQIVFFSPVDTE